ncbi:MAG: hypothetical protein WC229_00455 [Candidatus Paceibacterota bacterium]|jgi:hypothetical protein
MKNIEETFKNLKLRTIAYIIGGLIIALIIFQAGMFVGFKKAGFAFRMGEQYFRQMKGGPEGFPMMGIGRDDFGSSHGAIGKIVSIKLPSIVVTDRDGIEKTVVISTSTDIKRFKEVIKSEDLKINDFVTVIGSPDDKAQVEAKLIRIMPNPEGISAKDLPAIK